LANFVTMYPEIQLKQGKEFSIERQHPWIFSGAISTDCSALTDGELVTVTDAKKAFLAVGHYQHASIAVRVLSFEPCVIDSEFWLKKIENAVQLQNRTKFDWSKYIEFFSMPIQMGDSFKWKYTQEEYLEHIGNSKFGLCLPGYGPKCNREIEYFGLGVIPLITKDVCIKYPEPLLENIHFLRINSPEDIKKCLKNFSKDRWEFMSYSGRRWYERNCSPRGSFEITEKIVSSIK